MLDALVTRMKLIDGVAYKTNVANRVHLWEGEAIITGTPTPAIFIVPGEDKSDHQECYGAVAHDVAIACIGIVSTAGGETWKTSLADLMKDIAHAIELDNQLALTATWVEPDREDMYDETDGVGIGQILVTAHYRHSTTDPSVNAS
jgi:hypothetical protein